ncbi:MAG TPA: TPM domain-containing protein, partial [Bdellovibrionota bacterium]|nr:TPM domain-containing protein [Bdellovibrionota bacterium]
MRRLNFGFESARVALWSRVLFLLVGGLGFSSRELQAAKVSVPAATAPVVDEAQILNPSTRAELDEILRQVSAAGTQLGVLTVNSLEGLTIEEYGIAVAEAWKLGQAKTDRGAVLIVAPRERRVRIEVGYGLEGELTDLQSGRIINDAMIPYFKRGDWDGGVRAGVGGILSLVAPEALANSHLQALPPASRSKPGGSLFGFFVTFFLFLFVIRLFG